jgi:hypothetical protein
MRAASSSDAEGRQERPCPCHGFLISEPPLIDQVLDDLSWLYVGFGAHLDSNATRRMSAPGERASGRCGPTRWTVGTSRRHYSDGRRPDGDWGRVAAGEAGTTSRTTR